MNDYSSKLLNDAIEQFASLPGIGKKTALRLTLHMLKQDKNDIRFFGNAFIRLREEIKYCSTCFNISDHSICEICSNPKRDGSLLCVVENIQDVLSIENTHQYNGLFHVLGGIISPMDGIGPDELNIDQLIDRVKKDAVSEIIMALSSTMEGDTTNFYIYKRLKDLDVQISTIARGMAIGNEIEYTDEITLGKSIVNRIPYKNTLLD